MRGRLQRIQGSQPVPAGGIAVTLRNSNGSSLAVTSDANGMYYLSNVQPGHYTLQVWSRPGAPPLLLEVQVAEPRLDVNPLNLPYPLYPPSDFAVFWPSSHAQDPTVKPATVVPQ